MTSGENSRVSARREDRAGQDGAFLNRPCGAPRKLVNNSRLQAFGWEPSNALEKGIRQAIADASFNRATAESIN